MADYVKRKQFFRANKYQRPIIFLALIPTLLFCLVSTLFVLYFHRELVHMIKYNSEIHSVELMNQGRTIIVSTIWIFFMIVYVWAQLVSSKLVGAFERVIKDLDNVLMGNLKKPIRARDNDYLANELLARINKFIDKLNKPKTTGSGPADTMGRF